MSTSENTEETNSPAPDESPDGKPYYVLRRGEILGPFLLSSLEDLVKEKRVEYDDFVQQAGDCDWTPLRWLLVPSSAEALDGALAPTWRTLLKWSWLRLRYNIDEKSLPAGWVCLGFALCGVFLSRWPLLLWAPWAVFAFFGGVALYHRKRTAAGISLMLSAALIPGALWAYFWTDSLSASRTAPAPIIHVVQSPPSQYEPKSILPNLVPAPEPATIVASVPETKILPPAVPPPTPVIEQAIPVPPPAAAAPAPPAPVELPRKEAPLQPAPAPIQEQAPIAAPNPAPLPPDSLPQNNPSTGALTAKPPKVQTSTQTLSPELAGIASRAISHNAANLVFVSDSTTQGAGSGFICEFEGKPALFTNIHVVAGMQAAKFTTLDQKNIQTVGAPFAAVGHDIIRYSLPEDTTIPRLRLATNTSEIAAIGDEVFVLGNSEGARVITPLPGKISGLGPELIEVTAEFVPGNSGSPIIHAKTGTVIGIATYLSIRDKQWLSNDNAQPQIRRFGYRLDSIKQWQPLDWPSFVREKASFEKITQLTGDLANLLRDMKDGSIQPALHTNAAISSHLRAYSDKIRVGTRLNQSDRLDAMATLMRFMRITSQQDITELGSKIRYDYYQRQLASERNVRSQFAEIFDDLIKQIK